MHFKQLSTLNLIFHARALAVFNNRISKTFLFVLVSGSFSLCRKSLNCAHDTSAEYWRESKEERSENFHRLI